MMDFLQCAQKLTVYRTQPYTEKNNEKKLKTRNALSVIARSNGAVEIYSVKSLTELEGKGICVGKDW